MKTPNIARDIVQRIYNDTEGCADGAPDASAHDKLCNHVASLAKRALEIMDLSEDAGEHHPEPKAVSDGEYGKGFWAGALVCAIFSSITIAVAIFIKF